MRRWEKVRSGPDKLAGLIHDGLSMRMDLFFHNFLFRGPVTVHMSGEVCRCPSRVGLPDPPRSRFAEAPPATCWRALRTLSDILDQATTYVVRLVIIPILPQRAPLRVCLGFP